MFFSFLHKDGVDVGILVTRCFGGNIREVALLCQYVILAFHDYLLSFTRIKVPGPFVLFYILSVLHVIGNLLSLWKQVEKLSNFDQHFS